MRLLVQHRSRYTYPTPANLGTHTLRLRPTAHTRARIVDTRKTLPGLRAFEKHAVRCGGGRNHRFGLDDAILIKDNHIAVAGGVAAVLKRAKAVAGHLVKIEIEVDNLDQLREVVKVEGIHVILLDNMDCPNMEAAVQLRDKSGRKGQVDSGY